MKKDIRLTLRVSGVILGFIKDKLGLESDYDAVDKVLRMYYDYYNPEDVLFIKGCVPENEVSLPKIKGFKVGDSKESDVVVKAETKVFEKKEFISDDSGIITRLIKGKLVNGRLDDKGLFKRV